MDDIPKRSTQTWARKEESKQGEEEPRRLKAQSRQLIGEIRRVGGCRSGSESGNGRAKRSVVCGRATGKRRTCILGLLSTTV